MTEKDKKMIEELYQAFIYGYPAVVLEVQKNALTNTEIATVEKAPINQLIHANGIANAEDKYIVMLNMDTVYSQVYFDLKKGPIYFKKPKADRYVTAELIDAYGDCIEILGTGGIGGDEEVKAVLVGPDYEGTISNEFVRIDMPTNLCWTLIRVLANDNDTEDVQKVTRIQRGFDVRPLEAYKKEYVYPKGKYLQENDYITFEKINHMDVEEFFTIFNRIIGDNPGKHPNFNILDAVSAYGVGAGKVFQLSKFSVEAQEEIKRFNLRIIEDFKNKSAEFGVAKGNWRLCKENVADFGDDYLFRANIAYGGIGVNPVSMAIYPAASTDAEGKPLHSDFDYIVHFDSVPPVHGFWSLSAYGDDKFQIPNEIRRYGINDRSKFDLNPDGSLDIYVQRYRPEEEKINNWLPSGEYGFCLVLRLYLPKEEILSDKWKLPVIKIHKGKEKSYE